MSTKKADHYFLRGGGEMGELIRAKDWSNTALGDPANWPQSLRTMVGVMLDNPFGMYIAWGDEYIQLYNDGYRPILGANKHPKALGISTRETFSEIWHIIGSMFDGVMNGKAVGFPDLMLPLNRNGFVEECYFDFAYSPIRKDDGAVGGVLVTVIETTAKKRATEALKESNLRFINNIMQAPVAMCIFRGENAVVEIANEHMLEIWGKRADEVLHRPIFEGLPEAKDQGLEPLLEQVYRTGEKFTANERPVKLPRNGRVEDTYINFVYQALKESDGTISGVVAIASDVSEQVMSRSKIEESEQKVRALVENAPFPIAVYLGEEMIVELANQSIIDIWGKGNDVIGKSFKDVLPELDNQSVFEQIRKVRETGESFHTKNTPLDLIIAGKPYTYYFNYSLTPLYDINGKIYGVMNTGVDLTELNIAKKRIEESDKLFRNTMKQAPVGITILRGPEYIVEMANDAYLQLIDKKEADFVGYPLFDTLPEVEEAVHLLLDNVLNTGNPYHGNEVAIPLNRYGKKDLFYFDFVYHPLKEEDGKISGVIVIVTEVTEKVEMRNIIEERKRLYETITQNTPDLIYVFDLSYRFTYANEALLKMWGRTWDDAVGKNMLENGYEPWHAEMHEREIDQVIATKKSIRGEVSFHHAALGKRMYDYIFTPVINEKDEVEAVTGTTRDISDIKNAEEELKKSEAQFRLLADSMPQHIWTSDPEGNLNYYNKSVFDYSGLSPEQIHKDGWLQIVHPDDREENIREWQNAISTGKDFLVEHRFRRYDGEYRWQLSRAVTQRDENGKIQMWVGTSTDIQAQKTFTRELELLVAERTKEVEANNTELQKMNKELQSFAYISSHDLQEPLRKIQTFSSQIIGNEAQNLSAAGIEKFSRMQNAAKRMQTLINDLLAYSQTNTSERKFEKTQLIDIIEEVKEDLKEEIHQKNATVEVKGNYTANIIPFQFRQLLFNLINNALKFSGPKEPPYIRINMEIVGGMQLNTDRVPKDMEYCHISVSDNGIGFETQYREKIFEVFQRLHGKNEYAGTGIGLSIVKRIVENHNGFITANGELNKGATFDIYIPAV